MIKQNPIKVQIRVELYTFLVTDPVYPKRNSPRQSLGKKTGGTRTVSGYCEENSRCPQDCGLVTTLTELPRLYLNPEEKHGRHQRWK